MDVRGKLPSTVGMPEEVADDGEGGAEGLQGDVPAGADNLKMSLQRWGNWRK